MTLASPLSTPRNAARVASCAAATSAPGFGSVGARWITIARAAFRPGGSAVRKASDREAERRRQLEAHRQPKPPEAGAQCVAREPTEDDEYPEQRGLREQRPPVAGRPGL